MRTAFQFDQINFHPLYQAALYNIFLDRWSRGSPPLFQVVLHLLYIFIIPQKKTLYRKKTEALESHLRWILICGFYCWIQSFSIFFIWLNLGPILFLVSHLIFQICISLTNYLRSKNTWRFRLCRKPRLHVQWFILGGGGGSMPVL